MMKLRYDMSKTNYVLSFVVLVGLFLGAFYVAENYNNTTVTPEAPPEIIVEEPPVVGVTVEEAQQSITHVELKEMLYKLASPEFTGRSPGTEGFQKASDFVESEFRSYGLLGGVGNEYKQKFFDPRGAATWNLVGYLPGNDPKLKEEIVIIGAHLDHLGIIKGKTYYGADDNGSGSVGLLEIAEACSKVKDKLKRTIVFIAFSAEEQGLIGSQKYVAIMSAGAIRKFPLDKTVCMINMDMIGWLKKQKSLYCHGAGLSKNLSEILRQEDDNFPFTANITNNDKGPSDHKSFARKNIPVIFFHTGTPSGIYHTPNDTADKIDYAGMEKVSQFVFKILMRIDQQSATIDWGKSNSIFNRVDTPIFRSYNNRLILRRIWRQSIQQFRD